MSEKRKRCYVIVPTNDLTKENGSCIKNLMNDDYKYIYVLEMNCMKQLHKNAI